MRFGIAARVILFIYIIIIIIISGSSSSSSINFWFVFGRRYICVYGLGQV